MYHKLLLLFLLFSAIPLLSMEPTQGGDSETIGENMYDQFNPNQHDDIGDRNMDCRQRWRKHLREDEELEIQRKEYNARLLTSYARNLAETVNRRVENSENTLLPLLARSITAGLIAGGVILISILGINYWLKKRQQKEKVSHAS